MEPQEKLTTQQFVVDRLHDIQRKAEANNFADALATIKEVKTADAKNIYLIAIEKQIAKLSDTSLPEESRNGIVKSLPAMIDRAVTDIQRRFATAPKVDESQKEQKEAALEKLKSQYFQRADDYVEKHEYQRALEEIRRIYIIEPGSVVAKEYEQKIEQLAALHARSEAQAAAAQEAKERKAEVKELKKPETTDPKKIVPVVEPPKEKVIQPAEEQLKKSKLPILIAAAALVVLAIGAWFIFGRGPGSNQTSQGQAQQPPPAQESVTLPEQTTSTTSTSQSGKSSSPIAETSKQSAKPEKKQPETKLVSQTQKTIKPAVTPPSKTPATTQTQTTAAQPSVKQQASQTPPIAAVQQPAQQQPTASESTPAPMPFVAIENPPEVLRREPAKYPEIAIKMGIQGRVTVEVTVDAQGKPIQTKILHTTSDVFNDAAVEAVMKYTYKPAMQSNSPVTAKLVIPIKFNLQK